MGDRDEALVGRHHGRVMTTDEIGHHAERWRRIQPDVRAALAILAAVAVGGCCCDLIDTSLYETEVLESM